VLDGQHIGRITSGASVKIAVEPGTHVLRLGWRLLRSPARTFEIRDHELVQFTCRTRAFPVPVVPYLVASIFRHDLWIDLDGQ
jgi:hypothetical protein